MTAKDFKLLIEQVLDEKLDQALERKLSKALKPIKKDLSLLKKKVTSIENIQNNRVLPSVINTEMILKGYADAYKINKGNIERLDIRVSKAEEQLDIIPLPELVIQR